MRKEYEEWTNRLPEYYRLQAIKQLDNKVANTITNKQQTAKFKPLAVAKDKAFCSLVCIYVRSLRHRLPDSDGISWKAAVDGLVQAGILVNDSPRYVKKVDGHCEKIPMAQDEETIITITPVEDTK